MNIHPTPSRLAIVLLAAFSAQSLHAADVIKADNTDALNLGSSWTGAAAPTSADIAVWDSTVTTANAVNPGAHLSLAGIKISNPSGLVTINSQTFVTSGTTTHNATTDVITLNNTFVAGDLVTLAGTTVTNGLGNGTYYVVNPTATTFQVATTPGGTPINFTANNTAQTGAGAYAITLGSSGIDMSAATQNLTINSVVKIADAQSWNINTGRTLTLGAAAGLAGSQALTKSGAGTLFVNSANPSFSGVVNVNGGTLTLNRIGGSGSTSASIGSGQINMATGTTLRMDSAGNTFVNNAIAVADNASVTLSSANLANSYGGLVTGNSTSTLNIVGSVSLGNTGTANAQLAGFNGTVVIGTGGQIRFASTSGANGNGGSNTTFQVDGTGFINTRNVGGASGVVLGALTGNGRLEGQTNTTAGDVAYVIGGKNIDATFAGTIVQGANGSASIRKVGTGTQSFTGSMSSLGTISVTAGTAFFGGGFNKSGAGAITVSGGNLGGSNATLTGAASVSSLGTLRPNTAPSNATDRLTFATSLSLAGNTTFDLAGANFTGVTLSTAESLTYGGALNVNFTSTILPGTYDLFAFTDTNTGSFTSVNLTQGLTSIGGLTANLGGAGIWGGTYGGNDYTFNQATGDFTVALAAIPEPSTWAALAGLSGLALAAGRRRRRAA